MESLDALEQWRNTDSALLVSKQIKTVAYTCMMSLSFIGKLNNGINDGEACANLSENKAFGVWIRDCVHSLDHCSAAGDIGAATLGGVCGVISAVMLVLWQVTRRIAEKLCPIAVHVLFLLLVTGAIIGAESRSDTDLWLAIAALPALMLVMFSWQENRPETPSEVVTVGEETSLISLRPSRDLVSD